ncbi:phage tail protein [Rhodospirillum sp. A1_3_36]|uniref:phage tail protein n=1 Tax=Rhodospirillum sp. A1_3_36 TaxID=3391666 RepID=UPI0039A5FFD2
MMAECFVGEIRIFAGPRLIRNWAYCEGQLLPIAGNEKLYSVIGTTYGGNGISEFALPDLRGRVPMHMGNGLGLTPRTLGQSFGSDFVTLAEEQMPAHKHVVTASSLGATLDSPEEAVFATLPTGGRFYGKELLQSYPMKEDILAESGESQQHFNRMPSMALNYIIALDGEYPRRS